MSRLGLQLVFVFYTFTAFGQEAFLWRQAYNGASNSADIPKFIRTDSASNVYVAGDSGPGLFLLKYSSSGSPLWTYEDPGVYFGHAAFDTAASTILIGQAYFSESIQLRVIKVTSSGSAAWTNVFTLTNSEDATAVRCVTDAAGNVYVAATSELDVFFAKLSENGAVQWTGLFDSPLHENDSMRGLAVDTATGAMYLSVGVRPDYWSDGRYAFVKVVNGSVEWARYSPEAVDLDSAFVTGVGVSQDAGIYFTGISQHRPAVWKFANSGTQVWVQRYRGPATSGDAPPWDNSTLHGLAVDLFGNVTVIENSLAVHFDRTGVQQWSSRVAGVNLSPYESALTLDADQRPYLRSAIFDGSTPKHFLLTRFEPNGTRTLNQVSPVSNSWHAVAGALVVTNGYCLIADSTAGASGSLDSLTGKVPIVTNAPGPIISALGDCLQRIIPTCLANQQGGGAGLMLVMVAKSTVPAHPQRLLQHC